MLSYEVLALSQVIASNHETVSPIINRSDIQDNHLINEIDLKQPKDLVVVRSYHECWWAGIMVVHANREVVRCDCGFKAVINIRKQIEKSRILRDLLKKINIFILYIRATKQDVLTWVR